jgi:hypothetical protein
MIQMTNVTVSDTEVNFPGAHKGKPPPEKKH